MESPETNKTASDGRVEDGAHCANVRVTFPYESFAVLQCSMA
jgi:hypothetical protein